MSTQMTTPLQDHREFEITVAADDEYSLEMMVQGVYVGQIDYCPLDLTDPEDSGTLTIWRMYVEEEHRGQGYCVQMLNALRDRIPEALVLDLDMGTYSANRVVAKWLQVPVNDAGFYSLTV